MVIQTIVVQHFLYLSIREAEIFVEGCIGNRIYFEVIESSENALLSNAQASGQYGKFQAVIRL